MSRRLPAPTGLSLAALLVVPAALQACGAEEPERSLMPVVAERIAALGPAADVPAPPVVDADVARDVRGLAETRAHGSGAFRDMPLTEVANFGDRATAPLRSLAMDPGADRDERIAACELLGVLATPVAAAQLAELADAAPEAWLRHHAIHQLGRTGIDRHVPDLLRRLRYEPDGEAVVWTAVALATWSNYAAVASVRDLAKGSGPAAQVAREQLAGIEAQVGRSADEIIALWNAAPGQGLPEHAPSDALRGALWKIVPDFSGDTFQLRPVDDSRFTLSRLGPWAARELAEALVDTDPYIRLHGSQVLERMGPRAREAAPALLALLTDPIAGPAAAEALGRVGDPSVERALLDAAAADRAFELRNAAIRSLGRLGLASSLPTVVAAHDAALQADQPGLVMTSATARVLLDDGHAVARYLVDRLDGALDATEAEVALATWLTRNAAQGTPGFEAALGAWNLLGPRPGEIPDTRRARTRRTRRAELMRERLDALLVE